MDTIGAKDGGMKRVPVSAATGSACGRDCATCPKNPTCPLSSRAEIKLQAGRA